MILYWESRCRKRKEKTEQNYKNKTKDSGIQTQRSKIPNSSEQIYFNRKQIYTMFIMAAPFSKKKKQKIRKKE